jgi:hypothetical protein
MKAVSKYEVRCPRCDVTFPIETKRCIHCGGPTGPSVVEYPDFETIIHEKGTSSTDVTAMPQDEGGRFMQPFDGEMDDGEELGRRPSILRSVSTLIWIALAIAFSVMRACQGS